MRMRLVDSVMGHILSGNIHGASAGVPTRQLRHGGFKWTIVAETRELGHMAEADVDILA